MRQRLVQLAQEEFITLQSAREKISFLQGMAEEEDVEFNGWAAEQALALVPLGGTLRRQVMLCALAQRMAGSSNDKASLESAVAVCMNEMVGTASPQALRAVVYCSDLSHAEINFLSHALLERYQKGQEAQKHEWLAALLVVCLSHAELSKENGVEIARALFPLTGLQHAPDCQSGTKHRPGAANKDVATVNWSDLVKNAPQEQAKLEPVMPAVTTKSWAEIVAPSSSMPQSVCTIMTDNFRLEGSTPFYQLKYHVNSRSMDMNPFSRRPQWEEKQKVPEKMEEA